MAMHLFDLPPELIDAILLYMSYDEIARLRLVSIIVTDFVSICDVCLFSCQVCQFLNQTCGRLLTTGFLSVERHHAICLKKVKMQLPRRESERRNHPLARHCDILSAIETRLSLLGMTFMKYVDCKLCCFIPGKVIDEIHKLLRVVETSQNISRVHDLLQELRDISSMAMEYFEEKVAPKLKTQLQTRTSTFAAITAASKITMRQLPGQGTVFSYKSPFRMAGSEEISKLQQAVKNMADQHRADMKQLNQRLREQKSQIDEHKERIRLLEDQLKHGTSGPVLKRIGSPDKSLSHNGDAEKAANGRECVSQRTRSKRRVIVASDVPSKRKK
jgi:F-box protein 28